MDADDIDALVAELRERVEERRRRGAYPPGLETDLADHFRRVLLERAEPWEPPDLQGPLAALQGALPLDRSRIAVDSSLPGGEVVHRAIGKAVSRQTQGSLQQVQRFAGPAQELLERLVAVVERLAQEVHVEIPRHLDAILERQAVQERRLAGGVAASDPAAAPAAAAANGVRPAAPPLTPWYSSIRFEEEFRGGREELMDRYRDLADRLRDSGPVLDIGCGRGEFLELLAGNGIEAWGVDLDAELVKAATDRGLNVTQADGLRSLEQLDDASLGALVLIQVVEHLSAQEVIDLVALAATKVRPGGQVCVETVNPQSLYVFARAFWIDPTHHQPVHPAYLTFLFREAGFPEVVIDWRSPPPADEVLEEAPGEMPEVVNSNVRRLNQLLFAPQDYLLIARR
ncbi:MAG TPA: class I SAM-dependent methyltransferase [Acidimicrobiia bacterium]|nr:class I SAM-dependent methyltransferase [Acidimicrobiia bacterium]